MPDYRRLFLPGAPYFFTVVTHDRRPFLTTSAARACLRDALRHVRRRRPSAIVAIVLLPDHLHTVWTLPRGDADYATRWSRAKQWFTDAFLASGAPEGARSASRVAKRERAVWQRRYWEHTVRDEADLERCVDYVHWNPVKHGLATRVADYPWSSFHRYVREGHYDVEWGRTNPRPETDGLPWE
jgi:putative transposase